MLTLILSSIGFAVPLQVTQQGRILDSNGAGVSGLHDLTFRIYDAETSGTLLWEETLVVSMSNGYYATVLGTDETNNPLDSTILELYPIYLEFQLDSNSPVATRQAINSAPYAQIAGKAEVATSVNGGSVNATDVQISGNPVIDGTGSWVGQPITVDWNNIDPSTIPSYIADGDDNTQLSKTEVLNYVDGETLNLGASSQVDGSDIVTADSFSTYLPADADTLASLNCATGEIASWDGNSSWVCTSDNTLEWADIELLLNNNPVDLNASTTIGGAEIITTVDDADTLATLSCSDGEIAKYDSGLGDWYCDVDIDTTLTSTEVTTMVEAGSVNLATGSTMAGKGILTQPTACTDGQILVYSLTSGTWACGTDTNTTLTASEVQAMVESVSGLALQAGATVDGSPIHTDATVINPDQLDSSSASTDQVLKFDGSSVAWGEDSGGDGCEVLETIGGTPARINIKCGSLSYMLTGVSTLSATSLAKSSSFSSYHHCSIDSFGKINCWGFDGNGLVSDVPTGTFTSLTKGRSFACALNGTGNIGCWGANEYGQVSDVPQGTYSVLSLGSSHACALDLGGQIQCWGYDNFSQVTDSPQGTFTAISSGYVHSCGIKTDGTIACWGHDNYSQVSGTPSGTFESIYSGYYYNCGIKTDGTISCWGRDNYSQVTDSPQGTFTQLALGTNHSCGINTTKEIECWGKATNFKNTPSGIFSDLTVGSEHTCGLLTSGKVECWGNNSQIGGTPTSGTFSMIEANQTSTCGILDSGKVLCWGNDAYNQTSPP